MVTHRDNPKETIWFDSVAELAALHGIPTITPDNPNTPEVVAQIRALQPDFFFSFYYREMLKSRIAGNTQARRAEHARFAVAEIPRPGAGELGDNPRRERKPAARCIT